MPRCAYWIDIDADERDEDELRTWLQQFRLIPFLQRRLSESSQMWASQVLVIDKAVLVIVRILPLEETSDDLAHMAALLLPNLILTFTSLPKDDINGLYAQALQRIRARGGLPEATATGALGEWLAFHLERTSRAARTLRTWTLDMDQQMDMHIESIAKQQVIDTKHQLLRVLAVAEEQLECLEALFQVESTDLKLGQVFRVLKATAAATERMLLRLDNHLSDLRQRHDSHEQEATNRRLAVLTVLSAVFLPLTLITGIWGMNFDYMPELHSTIAYPLALMTMILIATSMICCFWRAGWLE